MFRLKHRAIFLVLALTTVLFVNRSFALVYWQTDYNDYSSTNFETPPEECRICFAGLSYFRWRRNRPPRVSKAIVVGSGTTVSATM